MDNSNGPPTLPPPQPFFSSNPPPVHNLPSISGLTQTPQQHPSQPASQHAASRPEGSAPPPPPPPSHGFSAINSHQSAMEAERERHAREMEDRARMEAEQRDRDMRDRLFREQQQHEPQVIHQPVAVPPSARSIHGPNGLLGNPAAANQPTSSGPPSLTSASGLFPPAPMNEAPRPPQPQLAAAASLMPFGPSNGQVAGSAGMNQAQQPILNDALSYLDQVKVQFAEHPDVYNRFLDIMKDFKSGAIDTPGVIERVSQLFAGNPALIQGFNTFLPPGYKIECGTGDDPNTIRVTTPMGTTVSTMPAARPLSPRSIPGPSGAANPADRPFWQQQQAPGGPADSRFSPDGRAHIPQPVFGGHSAPTSHPAHSPETFRQQQEAAAIHRVEQQNVAQLGNAAAAASARELSGRGGLISSPGDASLPPALNGISPGAAMMVNGGMDKPRGPVEFNHAISYVNKIKNRFAQQPDIYKQFLEILQTYQRESKPIQDVYAQVTRLFETAPDLLQDFKQFLPESAASNQNKSGPMHAGGEDAFPLSSTRNEPSYMAAAAQQNHLHQTPRPEQHRLPPMGNFAPTPSASRDNKRKRGERGGPSGPVMTPIAPEVGGSTSGRGLMPQQNGNKRLKQSQAPKQPVVPDLSTTTPSLIPPPLPVPMPPAAALHASQEDFSFFDRIRRHIGNKSLWAEFLKLLNLFKHDFIDTAFLVFKAQAFIGSNPDLMQQFKDYLKYKDSDVKVTNEPQTVNGRVQLSNCRGLGPSYRLLPKQETNKKCSGRDDLCNSVLNDDWVSHPTWASEDSGFVAHRKNQHEEGLHRVEEERHDYDFYIECCRRTIQLLEPIAQGIQGLTPDQRMAFQLDTKLGGQSEAIYRRVIFKIYGREKGNDVVRELFRRPYDVIPTLLARMKTQCEQWKAAQIQWEKVWRAQTDALFWKSLDHQGAATRVADKRQFFAKQLINEMQVKYQEHKRQRELNRVAMLSNYHFAYPCEDKQILRDSAGLLILYAEQNYSTEHPTLVKQIKELLVTFFGLGGDELDQESFAADLDIDMEGSELGISPRQRPAKSAKGGLLRGVLDKRRPRDENDSESRSRQSTPDETLAEMTDAEPVQAVQPGDEQPSAEKWFTHPIADNMFEGSNLQPNEPYKRSTYNMYANAAIYCFMRLFGMLVERLQKIKANEDSVRSDVQAQKEKKPAHELGWLTREAESYWSETGPTANYYAQMLESFKGLIRQDVDSQHVEDTLRRYYLQDGWQLYSLDKLLSAASKFAMSIFFPTDKEKTPEIYALFKKDRLKGEVTTHKEEVQYRRHVDRLAREGEIYRIGWDTLNSQITMQLIKSADPTFESSLLSRAENWKVYISSYETIYPTEGLDHSHVKLPFFKRNLRVRFGTDEAAENMASFRTKIIDNERMQFRISASTYRMEVEPLSTDYVAYKEIDVSKANCEKEAERRAGEVEEKWRANSEWMKGRSKDEVDAKKLEFREKFDEEVAGRRK